MEVKKETLEWIVEQLQYFETQASDIEEEAYNCRRVVQKIIKDSSKNKIKKPKIKISKSYKKVRE